ncbi:MAG: hypothetical protein QOG54_2538 [Actinomycetota bacterium]|jgi:hypothetical protein|nr:hypothetical protein [Actinomycetota bacterium]
MRKLIAVLAILGVIAGLSAAPAVAGKKKHVMGSFDATLAPFPKLAAAGDPAGITQPGCLAGQKDVHYMTVDFTAPSNGTLTATMAGFTGDWDLYITDADGKPLMKSENDQIQGMAAAEEEVTWILKAKETVGISPCNWAGAPQATIDYMFMGK